MTSVDPAPHATFAPLPFVTPPQWAQRLVQQWAELLIEQAHLEKKAASAALHLLFKLPAGSGYERVLSALAREELVHFERTLRLLAGRGLAFGPQLPSAYAEQLRRACRRTMPERLIDELLLAAIIESRSCERMGLLAAALTNCDDELAQFYAELVAAEARHGSLYCDIAQHLAGAAAARQRYEELGAHEAQVLRGLPFAPRLHSGLSPGLHSDPGLQGEGDSR